MQMIRKHNVDSLDMDETVVLSLLNGSELIGKYVSSSNNILHLKNTFQFVMKQNPDGTHLVGMVPACHFADDSQVGQCVSIPLSAIAMMYEASEQTALVYSNKLSPITIAPASALVGLR